MLSTFCIPMAGEVISPRVELAIVIWLNGCAGQNLGSCRLQTGMGLCSTQLP